MEYEKHVYVLVVWAYEWCLESYQAQEVKK